MEFADTLLDVDPSVSSMVRCREVVGIADAVEDFSSAKLSTTKI